MKTAISPNAPYHLHPDDHRNMEQATSTKAPYHPHEHKKVEQATSTKVPYHLHDHRNIEKATSTKAPYHPYDHRKVEKATSTKAPYHLHTPDQQSSSTTLPFNNGNTLHKKLHMYNSSVNKNKATSMETLPRTVRKVTRRRAHQRAFRIIKWQDNNPKA